MDKRITWSIMIIILLVLSFLVVKNIEANTTGSVINLEDVKNLHEVNFAIEGMYCDACGYAVKAQFEAVEGVVNAKVNAIEASGIVQYDADKVTPEIIAKASTANPATIIKDKSIGL